MTGAISVWSGIAVVVLVAGFAAASVADLRRREVAPLYWQVLGLAGVGLGAVWVGAPGPLPLLLWLLVGGFALQHVFPWEDALGDEAESLVLGIDIGLYLGVFLVVALAAARWGIGPTAVPVPVVAVYLSVVLARALYHARILYGPADAFAVMAAATLVPVWVTPVLSASDFQTPVLAFVPFAVTVLTNAGVVSVAVPIFIALRNVARGEFRFPTGFTRYTLAVELLPRRVVWVRDERVGEDGYRDDVDTFDEDVARRTRLAARLRGEGVTRVWVSPQLPFLVLLTLGVLTAVLAGNLLLQLFASL